jgi:hypothetical protein
MEKIWQMTTPPVVGKTYLVPCVRVNHLKTDKVIEVPVFDSFHEDPEIDPEIGWHYHVDHRFMSPAFFEFVFDHPFALHRIRVIKEKMHSIFELVVRAKSCWQEAVLRLPSYRCKFLLHLEQSMQEESVIRRDGCAYCPHRGMPLHDAAVVQGHVVECPGHALSWNLGTGRLVTAYELGR